MCSFFNCDVFFGSTHKGRFLIFSSRHIKQKAMNCQTVVMPLWSSHNSNQTLWLRTIPTTTAPIKVSFLWNQSPSEKWSLPSTYAWMILQSLSLSTTFLERFYNVHNVSRQTSCIFRFKLLQSSMRRKTEAALDFCFNRCQQAISWLATIQANTAGSFRFRRLEFIFNRFPFLRENVKSHISILTTMWVTYFRSTVEQLDKFAFNVCFLNLNPSLTGMFIYFHSPTHTFQTRWPERWHLSLDTYFIAQGTYTGKHRSHRGTLLLKYLSSSDNQLNWSVDGYQLKI